MLKDEQMVHVVWNDAYRLSSRWVQRAQVDSEPVACHTLGWLIHTTDDYLSVAGTIGEDEDSDIGEVIAIPLGCIVRITRLKDGPVFRKIKGTA